MTRKTLVALALAALAASPALAQQQPAPSPTETVLSARLLQEIRVSISCEAGVIDLRAKLAEAREKLKAAEPKDDEGKK
jgi:hypothetical protein